jgi:Rieske Fe-S protein
MDERIVIAQPTAGEFVAWSAICKHQGETVGSVEDNVIICPYHGSRYDAATGEVVGGPAPSGLDPVQIRVTNGLITQA